MQIALFYHSLLSCWNNGHAHFLRGLATELQARGHGLRIFEPGKGGWSYANLLKDGGTHGGGAGALEAFRAVYPDLTSTWYAIEDLDLDSALDGVDLVIAHEWNEPELIRQLGAHRKHSGYLLLFHDTHHRAVTAPHEMAKFELGAFDGALVYGEVLREVYLKRGVVGGGGWLRDVWTWHEAADTRVFAPRPVTNNEGDLVWIGNWGDEERSAELHEFLIEPVRRLGLRALIHGVRYPSDALVALQRAQIEYRGWLANARVPEVLARYRATVHVPRRPYVEALPGIPTIRIFEALACGIPLVCSPWQDAEHLFSPGKDFLVANDGQEMADMLRYLLENPPQARELAEHGLATIRRRHTMVHRVDELMEICRGLGLSGSASHDRSDAAAGDDRTRQMPVAATNGQQSAPGRGGRAELHVSLENQSAGQGPGTLRRR